MGSLAAEQAEHRLVALEAALVVVVIAIAIAIAIVAVTAVVIFERQMSPRLCSYQSPSQGP